MEAWLKEFCLDRGKQKGRGEGQGRKCQDTRLDPQHDVKSALGALAKGRKAKESGDSYQLREPSAPYGEHFGVKNEDIGLKNTYFWNFNPE